ncbi:MAG: LemA family protein, partial [bacterium]
MFTIAILAVLGAILAYAVVTYNGLVATKKQIRASIQEIGNQLKRQAELIPNLTESVKGYMSHEKGIFEKLAEARIQAQDAISSGSLDAMGKASEAITAAITPIRAVFESNPELKASEVVKSLMDNLRDTSDKVAYSRRLLIDLVADFNTKVATFPGLVFAKIFGFKEEKGIKTSE